MQLRILEEPPDQVPVEILHDIETSEYRILGEKIWGIEAE
jgi:hypothetical protein